MPSSDDTHGSLHGELDDTPQPIATGAKVDHARIERAVREILAAGATVRAHDPKANHEAQRALGPLPRLEFLAEMYDATQGPMCSA